MQGKSKRLSRQDAIRKMNLLLHQIVKVVVYSNVEKTLQGSINLVLHNFKALMYRENAVEILVHGELSDITSCEYTNLMRKFDNFSEEIAKYRLEFEKTEADRLQKERIQEARLLKDKEMAVKRDAEKEATLKMVQDRNNLQRYNEAFTKFSITDSIGKEIADILGMDYPCSNSPSSEPLTVDQLQTLESTLKEYFKYF